MYETRTHHDHPMTFSYNVNLSLKIDKTALSKLGVLSRILCVSASAPPTPASTQPPHAEMPKQGKRISFSPYQMFYIDMLYLLYHTQKNIKTAL